MVHEVQVENTFRGPLDLLLYLVKRDEIDIHDIPISHLTRAYLEELDRLRDLDIDLASEFLAMASLLMEIKSRMLLPPGTTGEEDEDEENFDPRAGLVQALLEYKRFKEAAETLGHLAEDHSRRFARLAPPPEFFIEDESEQIADAGVYDLLAAFQKMINAMRVSEAVEIVSDEVSTEVRIEQITTVLRDRDHVRFSELLSDEPSKSEMVGFFIAMLELIRLKQVRAYQTADFSEIYLEKRRPGEPARWEKQVRLR